MFGTADRAQQEGTTRTVTENPPGDPPGSLAAALAAFQAQIPRIRKDEAVDAGQYSYRYADLGDISLIAMPLLGAVGLSFTSRPTFNEQREFVLVYSLLHTSGEREDGEYPLPDPLRTKPQTLGSAITYAKRYSFCAITGVTPIGEDDGGAAAQETTASSRNPFNEPLDSEPVKPHRPSGGAKPVEDVELPPETDQDWLAAIKPECETFADIPTGQALWRRIYEKVQVGGCSRDDGGKLQQLIKARWKVLDADREKPTPDVAGEQPSQWPAGSAGAAAQEKATR